MPNLAKFGLKNIITRLFTKRSLKVCLNKNTINITIKQIENKQVQSLSFKW